jgi:hypothetical protein
MEDGFRFELRDHGQGATIAEICFDDAYIIPAVAQALVLHDVSVAHGNRNMSAIRQQAIH